MRVAVVLLCLLASGCAFWRGDRNQDDSEEQRSERPEPVKRPSEVLKPPKFAVASPISDYFYVRGSYFNGSVSTDLRLDSQAGLPGTFLNAETDLGLNDKTNQGRIEFSFRMRDRNRVRVDFFRTSRYGEKTLTQPIRFGEQTFLVNELVRSELEWRLR